MRSQDFYLNKTKRFQTIFTAACPFISNRGSDKWEKRLSSLLRVLQDTGRSTLDLIIPGNGFPPKDKPVSSKFVSVAQAFFFQSSSSVVLIVSSTFLLHISHKLRMFKIELIFSLSSNVFYSFLFSIPTRLSKTDIICFF